MNLESKIPVKTETETRTIDEFNLYGCSMFNDMFGFLLCFMISGWLMFFGSLGTDFFLTWAKTGVFGKKKSGIYPLERTSPGQDHLCYVHRHQKMYLHPLLDLHQWVWLLSTWSGKPPWWFKQSRELSTKFHGSWAANPNDGLVPQSSLRLKSSKASADPTQPPVIEGGVSKPAASRQPGLIIYWIYWLINTEVKIIHTAKHHACKRLPCCFTCRATHHGISVYLQIWKQSKNRIHRFIMIFPMFGYLHGSKSC